MAISPRRFWPGGHAAVENATDFVGNGQLGSKEKLHFCKRANSAFSTHSMRPILLFTIVPLLGLPVALVAGPQLRAQSGVRVKSPEKRAIERTLSGELSRATSNHVKIARWRLANLEIQGQWALASVTPLSPRDLDPFTALLRKKCGGWKIMTLGTNLRGSGKKFGAPRALWKKWDL